MRRDIGPVRRWISAGWLAMMILVLAACDDGSSQMTPEFAVSTRTLVPATATFTANPITPTPTATDLPAPSSFSLQTTPISVLTVPETAQALIDQTMDDLVAHQNVDPAAIRLLSLEAFIWSDESFGCTARYEDGYTRAVTISGYRILYSAGSRLFAYHTNAGDTYFLCPDRNLLGLEGEAIPTDPIAQAMVDLTFRDVSGRFDVPDSQIRLVRLIAVNWPDSSVGCPKPGGIYEDRVTPGYRIDYRVGDDLVIYHASVRDFVRCAPEEEIMPGALRQALRTPTPPPTPTE